VSILDQGCGSAIGHPLSMVDCPGSWTRAVADRIVFEHAQVTPFVERQLRWPVKVVVVAHEMFCDDVCLRRLPKDASHAVKAALSVRHGNWGQVGRRGIAPASCETGIGSDPAKRTLRYRISFVAMARTPTKLMVRQGSDAVTLENCDGKAYGRLRPVDALKTL
jgi:hypothetical protein